MQGRERRSGVSKPSGTAGAKGKGDGNDAVKERFRSHMTAWLLDNNLETLKVLQSSSLAACAANLFWFEEKQFSSSGSSNCRCTSQDVLLYHAIDDPGLLCHLKTEQIEKLTDKIGLRLRLVKSIEKYKATSPDWKLGIITNSRAVSSQDGHSPTSQQSDFRDKNHGSIFSPQTLESATEEDSVGWRSSSVEGFAAELSQVDSHREGGNDGISRESSTEDVVLVGTGRLFAF